MAALTAGNSHRGRTLSSRLSGRIGRVPSLEGGGRAVETWKSHIVRQLKHRDRNQHARFKDLVRFCTS